MMEGRISFLSTDEAKTLRRRECYYYCARNDGTCVSFLECMRAYSLAKDETDESKLGEEKS